MRVPRTRLHLNKKLLVVAPTSKFKKRQLLTPQRGSQRYPNLTQVSTLMAMSLSQLQREQRSRSQREQNQKTPPQVSISRKKRKKTTKTMVITWSRETRTT